MLDHPQFKEIANKVIQATKRQYNLVLVSLPGSGATFFAKKLVESGLVEKISYIFEENQKLGDFNILDLDFNKNARAIDVVDKYVKEASSSQKFLVIVNTPEFLKTPKYLGSVTSNRVFDYIYMPQMDAHRATILATNSKVDFDENLIEKTIEKTGGIARLVKYFLIHKEKLDYSLVDLMQFGDFMSVFDPTVRSIRQCDFRTLDLLGVTSKGHYISPMLAEYFEMRPKIEIEFEGGGVVVEKGKK